MNYILYISHNMLTFSDRLAMEENISRPLMVAYNVVVILEILIYTYKFAPDSHVLNLDSINPRYSQLHHNQRD